MATASKDLSEADRLLNWAEQVAPQVIAPRGVPTQTSGIYTYRFYPGTRSYAGIDDKRNVVYLDAAGKLATVGTIDGFWPQVVAAGF